MADKSITDLTEATALQDDGLTVVYQGGETKKIAGSALKTYARNSVVNYAEEAAAIAIQDATDAASTAETAKTAAQSAQTAAETAKNDAVSAKNNAQTYANNAINALNNVETVAADVYAYAQDAAQDSSDAEAFAKGTRNGVMVTVDDPAYQNNALYFKNQAQQIAGGDFATPQDVSEAVSSHNSNSNAHAALFAAVTLTAGAGINIQNGVISVSYNNAEVISY